MELPILEAGSTTVVEERWHGLLWSAVPQTVVASTSAQLVSYLPAGTVSVLATNRGMPGTAGQTRDERKLLALKTCRARAAEFVEWPDKLYLYRPDRWSRVNLGWDPDTGVFLGWYVNFELPPRPTANGLVSKDLVLDLCVNADRIWRWKDEDDYLRALDDGILDPAIRAPIQEEASRVLRELDARTGPFADSLTTFRPPSSWSIPRLPTTHCLNGDQWTLGDAARSRRAQP